MTHPAESRRYAGAMFYRLPKAVPPAGVMLADLGYPTAADVARHLGVSVRTVWRWRERDEWPRLALLALFFASRYGWSTVQSDALYALQTARQLADARERELEAARAAIRRLESIGDFGAANSPLRRA